MRDRKRPNFSPIFFKFIDVDKEKKETKEMCLYTTRTAALGDTRRDEEGESSRVVDNMYIFFYSFVALIFLFLFMFSVVVALATRTHFVLRKLTVNRRFSTPRNHLSRQTPCRILCFSTLWRNLCCYRQ